MNHRTVKNSSGQNAGAGGGAAGLLRLLDKPSREYTPIPFWFLNGDLTHREIRRQLLDFSAHGVYGVVLHPRMGLSRRIAYLSPLYFRYLRTAVETAAEQDMKIVLYDEGMYPSGSACGQVVRDHPEWASRGIALTRQPLAEDHVLCETKDGFLVERFSGGTIRGVHYGEDDGEAGAPKSADILNPSAVRRFMELTHEAYLRELGDYFGNTIIGFFTDEPSILGRNVRDMFPWTAGFEKLFEKSGGRLEGLADLFTGRENEDTALYRRLIRELEEKNYYAPLSVWCASHGIALMGHPHQSDDIEVEKYFHIPGQDLVFRMVSPEKGDLTGMDSTMAKCSADMARLMGRKRNSNECFGACNRDDNPWYFTGSDMKWFIDYLAVRGVNLFIPHAFYYSLRGKRSAERPPDVGPGNIWWPHYKQWADYMSRVSALMSEGCIRPGIALLCRNRELHPEAAAPLFESQRAFQYLPESVWSECREEGNLLFCRGAAYAAVAGPEELFPGVSHDPMSVQPDCLCEPPQPYLRCARLRLGETDVWFLVNAGLQEIETDLVLPVHEPLGRYDLWKGQALRQESRDQQEGRRIHIRLERNESTLFFTCESREVRERLPEAGKAGKTLTEADFTLLREDGENCRKIYTARVERQETDLTVEVETQEMAEVYAGEELVGAAFWPPQRITVPAGMLRKGPVTLKLVITGSRANRYGRPVAWNLGGTGKEK